MPALFADDPDVRAAYERGRAMRTRDLQNALRKKPANAAAGRERCRKYHAKNRAARRAYLTNKENLRKYGISTAEKAGMYEAQRGLCAICGEQMKLGGYGTHSACVDHDHATGKVRALLCNGCNTGLGSFRENSDALLLAVKYLEQHAA